MNRNIKKALDLALDAEHPKRFHHNVARTGYADGGLSSPMDIAHDTPYMAKPAAGSPAAVANVTPYTGSGIDLPSVDKIGSAPKSTSLKVKAIKPQKIKVRKPRAIKPHKIHFDKGGSAISDALDLASKLTKDMPLGAHGMSSSQGASSTIVKEQPPGKRTKTIYEHHEQTPEAREFFKKGGKPTGSVSFAPDMQFEDSGSRMVDHDDRPAQRLPMRQYQPRFNAASGKFDAPQNKDIGFYGPMRTSGNNVASEYSMDADIGQYPSIAADMPEDLRRQAFGAARFEQHVPQAAADFAYNKAKERMAAGRSPFYEPGRDPYPKYSPDQYWDDTPTHAGTQMFPQEVMDALRLTNWKR